MSGFKKITQEGEKFIKHICDINGMNLLTGKNKYKLPFSDSPYSTQTWMCTIKNPLSNGNITNGSELAQALIFWFNKYSEIYGLNANVIAAQAYVESGYRMWNYAGGDSTASGINQFTMTTTFGIIVKNIYDTVPKFTDSEINIITNGLTEPSLESSYIVGQNTSEYHSDTYNIAWANHSILHQNIINNPDLMIKAQCRYMKYISDKCNSLASTTLFGYSRGPNIIPSIKLSKKTPSTYSEAINYCKQNKGSAYLDEGVSYVLRTFAVLGDKNNTLSSGKQNESKGYSFGYDNILKLNEPYDSFTSNTVESNKYD